jgi:putative phosphoribosyl transferase
MIFWDRAEAGRILAGKLLHYKDDTNVRVLALPRGGVPVASEVARTLNVPIDVFVVRKLGVPGHEELAMGAIGAGKARFINEDVVGPLQIPADIIERVAEREEKELERREKLYRGERPPVDIEGRTVILIDDGLATGASMFAALAALRQLHPKRVIVAVPVAPGETVAGILRQVDEVVCLMMPTDFQAVGQWYHHFGQTTDDEVRDLLKAA